MNLQRNITPRKKELEEKLIETLEYVNKNYCDGFVEFWDAQSNNQWQYYLDQLEKSFQYDSDSLLERKILHFKETAKIMLEKHSKWRKKIETEMAKYPDLKINL